MKQTKETWLSSKDFIEMVFDRKVLGISEEISLEHNTYTVIFEDEFYTKIMDDYTPLFAEFYNQKEGKQDYRWYWQGQVDFLKKLLEERK